MTKAKLKQLRDLLDELEEERQQFGRDAGVEVDDEEFAKLASRYLGRELPRLGEVRDQSESDKPRTRRARDTRDLAEEFERNCRELRLKLQRDLKA
jgi:hypothetical protein